MDGILSTVMGQLGGDGLGALSGMLGLGKKETEGAVGTAVSVLTGAMAQSAAKPKGAKALDAALEKDHDGSIFDNLSGYLGDAMSGPGAGILGHVLGNKQPQVAQGIAEQTGLSLDKVMPLLITVAPLVMGVLGKMKKDKGLDAGALATTLAKERAQAEAQDDNNVLGSLLGMLGGGGSSKSSGGGLLGMLGGLFGGNKKKG